MTEADSKSVQYLQESLKFYKGLLMEANRANTNMRHTLYTIRVALAQLSREEHNDVVTE